MASSIKADYVKQFTTRIRENLVKINRVERVFKENEDTRRNYLKYSKSRGLV